MRRRPATSSFSNSFAALLRLSFCFNLLAWWCARFFETGVTPRLRWSSASSEEEAEEPEDAEKALEGWVGCLSSSPSLSSTTGFFFLRSMQRPRLAVNREGSMLDGTQGQEVGE